MSEKDSLQLIQQNSFLKFKNIFDFAFHNSSFYNKKYKELGISPETINTIEDLKKIPILTKQEVKDNLYSILTVPPRKSNLIKGATGGSTGTPMIYFSDRSIPVEAFSWRYLSWWGLKPWDNGGFVWRMRRKGKFESFLNRLAWWPIRKIRLDSSFLNENKMFEFLHKVNKIKPALLQGYVGSIYEFALFIDNNKLDIFPPKAVWVTSAPLTKFQRDVMERVFKAPVYNEYGSSEIPWIGAQCINRNGLHLNSEGRYFELINIDESGEGDVIITDLLNFKFPLIRYQLGDRAKFIQSNCGCGVNLPLIDDIKGRTGDKIIIPNLGTIDCSFLTTIFDDCPNSVLGFQIIQNRDFNITLRVVPNKSHENCFKEINVVFNNFVKLVKNKVVVKLEEVSSLPSDRGKTRYIIRE
jgi:phenylacetate-CoA ligase